MTESLDQSFDASSLILDGSNPLFRALPERQKGVYKAFQDEANIFLSELDQLKKSGITLFAHGTDSGSLPSILQKGLGADKSSGTVHDTKSVTDVATLDGLLGAYLFAKGLKRDMLSLNRENVDPKGDILARYTQVQPIMPDPILRPQIEQYFQIRAQKVGRSYTSMFPVLLIYSPNKDHEIEKNNRAVPSERKFKVPFTKDELVMVCAPTLRASQAMQILSRNNVGARYHSMEAIELM